jgi:hypothetical protein
MCAKTAFPGYARAVVTGEQTGNSVVHLAGVEIKAKVEIWQWTTLTFVWWGICR